MLSTTRLLLLAALTTTLYTAALLTPSTSNAQTLLSPSGFSLDTKNQLKKGNGWLGVGLMTVPLEDAKKRGFKHPLVVVDKVFPGSPAEASEFEAGDIILEYNKAPILETRQLVKLVGGTAAGSQVTFVIMRGKKRMRKPLMLAVRPDKLELTRTQFLNKPAPTFISKDIHTPKTLHNSDAYKGKIVVLDFWATWCGPCRKTIPHLNTLAAKYKDQNVVVLGISSENADTLKNFTQKTPISYTLGFDKERASAKAYMVSALPTLFLIDAKGIVREVLIGGGSKKAKQLDTQIQKLLNEK